VSTAPRLVITLALVASVFSVCACAVHAEAVWGTGLCFAASDPGMEAYWEYCYHISWDTTEYGGHGLSHSTIYLELATCECACEPGYFEHRIPAGVGVGEEGCEVEFLSEFDCLGDPHFPVEGPTMKFEPVEGACEPGTVGWMHVCYYSLFPPCEPGVFPDHVAVKFGTNVELGTLEGVLPYCDCSVTPVEYPSWGAIKAMYR
jgi:hypothetical protein